MSIQADIRVYCFFSSSVNRHRSLWNGIQAITADGRGSPTVVSENGKCNNLSDHFQIM